MTPSTAALLWEWAQQLSGGHLTDEGLIALRVRLDPTSGEFEQCAPLELLRLQVNEELAKRAGRDPDEMPDRMPWDEISRAWYLADQGDDDVS